LADREGFEPPNEFPRYALSKRAHSTTLPPVQAQARQHCEQLAWVNGGLAAGRRVVGVPPMPPSAIFMGTPEIAVPALRLLASRAEVRLVITQPDRPAGRGMKLTPPPIKIAAQALGLPVWQPETMRGAESDPRLAGHDLFVVMAYGEILRQPVLSLPKACINLHASLLPRWRGASPLQAAIRAGDAETGVSVMEMVPALDAGPVYLSERIPLTPTTTLPELHDRVAATASQALRVFLDSWPNLQAVPQDERLVTVCRKLTSTEGHLDWSKSADEIESWIRAYTPAPGCWTQAGQNRLRLLSVRISANTKLHAGQTDCNGGKILVGCGSGVIEILRLQSAGKAPMSSLDFVRGNTLPAFLA
jgi:methionyl-tRNA formyltransferase